MKKFIAIFFCVFLIAGIFLYQGLKPNYHTEYLRIHIRANSNSYIDQNIKYKIKDNIVEYLTPLISSCNTKKEFECVISKNLANIEKFYIFAKKRINE